MLKEERHDFILNEVRIRNRVLLSDLAARLEVSEDTVRRDLTELHLLGKLKKVHGGAVAKSFTPFSFRQEEIYDHQNKQIIARKAYSTVWLNMAVGEKCGKTAEKTESGPPPHRTDSGPSAATSPTKTRNQTLTSD